MPGQLTALIAGKIAEDWEKHGYDVFYDHGTKGVQENVGKIVSWFGNEYNRDAGLDLTRISGIPSALQVALSHRGRFPFAGAAASVSMRAAAGAVGPGE